MTAETQGGEKEKARKLSLQKRPGKEACRNERGNAPQERKAPGSANPSYTPSLFPDSARVIRELWAACSEIE